MPNAHVSSRLMSAIGLAVLSATILGSTPPSVAARTPRSASQAGDTVAALKQSIQENQVRLRRYQWIETTAVSLKGDEKSRKQNECYYDVEGKVQKVPIASAAPQEAPKRGLRGKIVEHKKEELTDYMQQAVALVHAYVPPDPELIQAAKNAGRISIRPGAGNSMSVQINDYRLQGDVVAFEFDRALSRLLSVRIATYLESPQDAISLDVTYSSLPDGTNHPSVITLGAPAKDIRVVVENGGYRPGR